MEVFVVIVGLARSIVLNQISTLMKLIEQNMRGIERRIEPNFVVVSADGQNVIGRTYYLFGIEMNELIRSN